jgi:hypothetical protein
MTEQVLITDILFGGEQLNGEVGIEVEMEGSRLPEVIRGKTKYWDVTRDGSLRGEAFEYVLSKPVPRKDVDEALGQLYDTFKACSSVPEDSGRAGVHVHVNIRDLTLKQLYNFIFLYLVFDKVLVDFCGDNRVGNLFCLRAEDAEFLLVKLRQLVSTHHFPHIRTDNIRYSSINLTAITKYGSLEFRSLPSPVEKEVISLWTQMLLAIKDKAITFRDPRDIVLNVSEMGADWFAKQVFGDLLGHLKCEDWAVETMSGIRKIQPIVNSFNDKVYEEVIELHEKRMKQREAAKLANTQGIAQGIDVEVDIDAERIDTTPPFFQVPTTQRGGVPAITSNLVEPASSFHRQQWFNQLGVGTVEINSFILGGIV